MLLRKMYHELIAIKNELHGIRDSLEFIQKNIYTCTDTERKKLSMEEFDELIQKWRESSNRVTFWLLQVLLFVPQMHRIQTEIRFDWNCISWRSPRGNLPLEWAAKPRLWPPAGEIWPICYYYSKKNPAEQLHFVTFPERVLSQTRLLGVN